MRVFAGAFLAMLATGPTLPGPAAGIGMTLDAHPAARCAVTTTATIVAYDATCLLYTSPSPRDGLLSRMPSSA